jgi:2-methylcitrate dehydratase PrpD
VLDTLGTTLGGWKRGFGDEVVAYTRQYAPGDAASILGDGGRSSMEGAAFANATNAKMLGMDDSHRNYGHVGAEVFPAVLAVSEANKRSGKDLITAMAAGYDVFGRIGRQTRKTHIARGLDGKGTLGTLGSAVAAGYAFGFDAVKMNHALAIAASLACGMETYTQDPNKTHTKDLIAGFGARNGVFAAQLAASGMCGPRGAIEGEMGFISAFGDQFDAEATFRGLGREFEIETIGFKPHAGCRHVHQGVDVAWMVRGQDGFDASRVAKIELGTYKHAIEAEFRRTTSPESLSSAGYSIPTAVCVGLVFGAWYPEDVQKYNDPRVAKLLATVTTHEDTTLAANGAHLKVTMDDGRTFEARTDYAKGEPENMLTDEEFEAKFKRLGEGALSSKRLDEIIAAVWSLEQVSDVGALARLVSQG